MEKRIALVTCSNYPQLSASDRVLAAALWRNGTVVRAVDWRDEQADWRAFDVAVVRSTWDYHLHPEEFAGWIDRVAAQTRLVNAPSLLRWNSNKRYLADLRNRGVPMLPFVAVDPGRNISFAELDRFRWRDLVLKPLVGASAWQIIRAAREQIQDAITPELTRSGYLIQPFTAEVRRGEYSLVFFDGVFSHAVLKTPADDDFRSQQEHGARHNVVDPGSKLVSEAAMVLDAIPEPSTYARIDGIVQNGRFMLMEAELIEPELFFQLVPHAAQTFAQSILKLI